MSASKETTGFNNANPVKNKIQTNYFPNGTKQVRPI